MKDDEFDGVCHDMAAVVVAYFPPRQMLALLETLSTMLAVVWVVDNSPQVTAWLTCGLPDRVKLLWPGENLGVAGAYNLAVRHVRADAPQVRSLFLFDQDSEPDAVCLRKLGMAMQALREQGENVAQVGPAYYEKQRGFYPPLIEVGRWTLRRTPLDQAAPVHRVSYMISSGSLISLAALERIGGFDESLFIDYVDVEFGLRCQHAGLSSWIVKSATMTHAIGEAPLRFGPWSLPSHSGLRRRYQARNAILLMRRPWVPMIWKLQELLRAACRFGFMLLARNRLSGQLAGWGKGIWDGMCNRRGVIQSKN